MFSPKQISKIKTIFRYTQTLDRVKEDRIYIDSLDALLAIASFALDDPALYPHWTPKINIGAILEIVFFMQSYEGKEKYVREILYFFKIFREEIWDFIDRFDLLSEVTMFHVYFKPDGEIRDTLEDDLFFFLSGSGEYKVYTAKYIEITRKYIETLADSQNYKKLIAKKNAQLVPPDPTYLSRTP